MSVKRVPFTVVFHLEMEFPEEDYDAETARFYIEENHCLDNHVDTLAERIASDDQGICQTCDLGAAFVGHVPLDKIGELARIVTDGPEQYMCLGCGNSVAEFRWCEQYAGTESVRADGTVCCTANEGRYPTAESTVDLLAGIRVRARAALSRAKAKLL